MVPDVFAGLTPRHSALESTNTGVADIAQRTLRNGIPLLMTGSLAAGVGVTSALPVAPANLEARSGETKVQRHKTSLADLVAQVMAPATHRVISSVAPDMPATYRVKAGETVTSVAEKFSIPTPLLLGLNGLSWNSILHEGQVLSLTGAPGKQRGVAPGRMTAGGYLVHPGDTLSSIAATLRVSVDALAQANSLAVTDTPPAGHRLVIPHTEVENAGGFSGRPTSTIVLASFDALEDDASDNNPGPDSEATGSSETPIETADPLQMTIEQAPTLRVVKKEPASKVTESTKDSPSRPEGGAITPLNDTRRKNAQIIVDVGRDLGVPDYGIVIALATAMQESSLRNIDYGDRDSVGLFQQRPSSGWGSAEQLLDPAYAARAFYGGPGNPSPGRLRGLLDFSGWQSLSLTAAAQRVQRSAHPDAYAKWEASAWAWLDELS